MNDGVNNKSYILKNFMKVQLIYNAFVSSIYGKVIHIVPWAIQQDLVVYPYNFILNDGVNIPKGK